MSIELACPSCQGALTLPTATDRFYCPLCRRVVARPQPQAARAHRGRMRRLVALPAATLLLALALAPGVVPLPCRASGPEAERAVMRYVAALTERWGMRPVDEFRGVSTAAHAATLAHPASPPRAIFSPYIQWLRIERIDARCASATVTLTVATGYKPTLALPRPVEVRLIQEGRVLKVAAVAPH